MGLICSVNASRAVCGLALQSRPPPSRSTPSHQLPQPLTTTTSPLIYISLLDSLLCIYQQHLRTSSSLSPVDAPQAEAHNSSLQTHHILTLIHLRHRRLTRPHWPLSVWTSYRDGAGGVYVLPEDHQNCHDHAPRPMPKAIRASRRQPQEGTVSARCRPPGSHEYQCWRIGGTVRSPG